MEEKPHQSQAFEVYYDMGKNRSLTRLADKLDYSVQSVLNWSKEFRWQDRIAERDKQNLAIMRRQRLDESEKMRTVYQQAIRQVLAEQFLKPLKSGELDLKVDSLSDVRRMMEMDINLERIDRDEEKYNAVKSELDDDDIKVIEMINADGNAWQSLTDRLLSQQKNEIDNGDDNG